MALFNRKSDDQESVRRFNDASRALEHARRVVESQLAIAAMDKVIGI